MWPAGRRSHARTGKRRAPDPLSAQPYLVGGGYRLEAGRTGPCRTRILACARAYSRRRHATLELGAVASQRGEHDRCGKAARAGRLPQSARRARSRSAGGRAARGSASTSMRSIGGCWNGAAPSNNGDSHPRRLPRQPIARACPSPQRARLSANTLQATATDKNCPNSGNRKSAARASTILYPSRLTFVARSPSSACATNRTPDARCGDRATDGNQRHRRYPVTEVTRDETPILGDVCGSGWQRSAAGPGSALASPLLSGYGGPGDGEQVILGSQLINGPGGGRGNGGASLALSEGHGSRPAPHRTSTARRAPAEPLTAAAPRTTAGSDLAGAGKARANSRRTPGTTPTARPTSTNVEGRGHSAAQGTNVEGRGRSLAPERASAAARPPRYGPALNARPALRAGESGLLGLSGSDLLLTFALVSALGLMAVAVRRLARPPQ